MSHFDESPDELDRLFARLERAPVPPDLTARVLASTVERRADRRLAWPWLAAGLTALGVVAVAGYLLGASLAASDGLDLLEAIGSDLSLLSVDPGDVITALAEVVAWPLVLLGAASAALVTWALGRALPARRGALS
jgi:hypothetical protein